MCLERPSASWRSILAASATQIRLRQEVHYTFTGASRCVPLPHFPMTSGIGKRNQEWADAEAAE